MRSVRLVAPVLFILCSLLATTGCGAGQVAQTSTEVSNQEGASANRNGVSLRDVRIPAPTQGSYRSGSDAPVYLAIATDDEVSDTLVGVTTEAATSVIAVPSPFGQSGSPAPPAAPSPALAGSEAISLDIGTGTLVLLAQGMSYLEMRGLSRDLIPGDSAMVTFSFARAGDITIEVPVATPDAPGPRLQSSGGTG